MRNSMVSAIGSDPATDSAVQRRMECRICWHVYDPADGDGLGQMPPGTPFAALPDDWRCPNCDAAKEMFLVLD